MTGRRWTSKAWICCLPEFKGWTRTINPPGKWTQLFFADDLVALSAGHRPCHTCRRQAFLTFQQAFGAAHPELGAKPKAPVMDAMLHAARLTRRSKDKRTYEAALGALPHGVFVQREGRAQMFLWWQEQLWRWSFAGLQKVDANPQERVNVLTPKPVVRMLSAGYMPEFLPTRFRS
jgi:hypothetical protein